MAYNTTVVSINFCGVFLLKNKFRILLADDEPRILSLLDRGLTLDGHSVCTATNGSEALTACMENQFDIAIFDMSMTDISGLDVAEELRAQNNDMPIILLTGHGYAMDKADPCFRHVDLVLDKPVSLSMLTDTINTVINNKKPLHKE